MGLTTGIPNPLWDVQHAKLVYTNKTSAINTPTLSTSESEWIDQVSEKQKQFGKINRFGKTQYIVATTYELENLQLEKSIATKTGYCVSGYWVVSTSTTEYLNTVYILTDELQVEN